ncbi:MAG: chitobiase/beta-hexosaminidase C-terminal domain-containing protein, partial [Candidatus Marinimicrobia bacterium]|nr:chitobiase/beta-hexosaminidase C-terminal domain-containing protein [Candidatus Neomarinimicrobiota bacterium]
YNYLSPGLTLSDFAVDFSGDTLILKFYATFEEDVPSTIITETYIKRDTLDLPTADPATTWFMTDTSVVLSHTESGITIRYTIDGTTPTSSTTVAAA